MAQFQGIAWDHGDNLCYCICAIPTKRKERLALLIRIIARSQHETDALKGAANPTPLRFHNQPNAYLQPVRGEPNASKITANTIIIWGECFFK